MRILMLGPSLRCKGGMSAVEEMYLNHWSYPNTQVRHIGTYVDGLFFWKLLVFISAVLQYVYLMITWRPSIIHLHFAAKGSFIRKSILLFIGKLFKRCVVLHCHASKFDTYYETLGASGRRLIRCILNLSDGLIVVSEAWKDYFLKLGISTPVYTLYNPVVPQQMDNSGMPAREGNIILSLGRLGKRKGTYDLLNAVPIVLRTCPTAEFWLGGDGEIAEVQEVLDRVPWGNHVKLLGWVTGEEKHKALSAASVFVLPSYHEGLPVAILEAMSYGIPVISTTVGGIPEFVKNGATGFLVSPGDVRDIAQKIVYVLENTRVSREIGERGRGLVNERCNIKEVIDNLFRLYTSLTK
jgi:glycosyltransferase involved in cell wall biosynthesis